MQLLSRIVAVLMAAAFLQPAQAQTPSHADSFSSDGLFKADVAELKDTQLVAHPDVPLEPGKNVLWCGTLQLAWNKAIGLVGEKLRFKNEPSIVGLLNQEDFTDADLDPACYVAMADFERNHVEDEIRAALQKTFGGAASPELIPEIPKDPGPDAFLTYAYLFKNLAFEQPFADKKPFEFETTPVKNFGFDKAEDDQLRDKMADQVTICYYGSEANFIIKFKTKFANDEVILAEIPASSTLQAMMNYVVDQAGNVGQETVGPYDTLSVPKLNFDLRGDFPTLENLVLQTSLTARVHDLILSKVKQLVRFQLNENGAVLKSEGEMQFAPGMALGTPPKIHKMIFDRPFLILMKQANSPKPYFALWVGNASLLVPAK